MLSAITWTNRGLFSDRFESTFGDDAEVARGVIDAAIDAWERVLVDFNQPGGGNEIGVHIAMDFSGTGFGASATVTANTGGYPTAGSLRFQRGNDTTGDGNGDGDGYFLDPTPEDHSEFTGTILHAFTGNATSGGPALGKSDLFTLAVHELAHVLGIVPLTSLKIHNPLVGSVTDTGIVDNSEGDGIGRYFVFDGPSVTHLMTSNNGGPSGDDANRIVHSAGPNTADSNQPVTFNSVYRGTRELVGTQDIINSIYEFGRRYLPTDYIALMFQDAFGYEVVPPQTFGTFYAMLDESTGELLVRGRNGSANSDDVIEISREGADLRVSVDIGADAPGSGPNGDASDIPAYVSHFPYASVSSITVQGFDGNDELTVDFSGGDPLPAGGLNYAAGFGTSNTLTVDLANSFEANHTGIPTGTMHFPDTGRNITYDLVQTINAVGGSFSGVESLDVAPNAIGEGESVLVDLAFNPGTGGHTVTIDWGDGEIDSLPLPAGVTQLTAGPHVYADDVPSGTLQDDYTIEVAVVDEELTTVFSSSETVSVSNEEPILESLSLDPSTVIMGDQATLAGTYADPGVLDTHVLDVDLDGDGTFDLLEIEVSGGTFSQAILFNESPGEYTVSVRLRDDDGGEDSATVPVTIVEQPSELAAAHLFYNNSAFDDNGDFVDQDDFAAIATDKQPLIFGDTGSFANVSGYSRGINGLFIDVAQLPNDGAAIDAADFRFTVGNDDFPDQWPEGPAATAVGVFPGQGTGGSDRIYVTFADGAVSDAWLRVTMLANADTGLPEDETFFFGSAPGETGTNPSPGTVGVSAVDLLSVVVNLTPLAELGAEPITEPSDLNRDRSVSALDLLAVVVNLDPAVLDLITPQPGVPVSAFAASGHHLPSEAPNRVVDEESAGARPLAGALVRMTAISPALPHSENAAHVEPPSVSHAQRWVPSGAREDRSEAAYSPPRRTAAAIDAVWHTDGSERDAPAAAPLDSDLLDLLADGRLAG